MNMLHLLSSRRYRNVCFFSSTYSLLLYLCYSSGDDIENTFFVFSETFPRDIFKNFNNSCYIPQSRDSGRFNIQKKWALSKYYKLFYIPRVRKDTKIFCQDHTTMLKLLIGNHPYILVAENPIMEGILKSCHFKERVFLSFKEKLNHYISKKMIREDYDKIWGCNKLCYAAIIADEGSIKYLDKKEVEVVDIFASWNRKATNEKNTILNFYGISSTEIESLKSKKIIIFTQPFLAEMTLEENIDYMVKLINKYPHNNIVIKVHPRDGIDYEKLFPDVLICKLQVPSQLFDLLGVHFELAATYNSSAVYNMSYDIKIDWYGEEIKHYFFDEAPIPVKANLCRL